MNLEIYLTFDQNCREAFEWYRSLFGGEFLTLQTFADGPPGLGVSDHELDLIMHVSLPIGSSPCLAVILPSQSVPTPRTKLIGCSLDCPKMAPP